MARTRSDTIHLGVTTGASLGAVLTAAPFLPSVMSPWAAVMIPIAGAVVGAAIGALITMVALKRK
jgi:hypothetical protein